MSFTRHQLKKLATPLDASRIQSREQDGKTLSYIEGWFVIAEANRIFGYEGWDRQMVHFERLFERRSAEGIACGYLARVAIKVRAQDTTIVREGTGFGQASAKRLADAHELALKAAETDATKRALSTFGGRFGLMLYDKEQRQSASAAASPRAAKAAQSAECNDRPARSPPASAATSLAAGTINSSALNTKDIPNPAEANPTCRAHRLTASDGTLTELRSPEGFCSGLRQLIEAAASTQEVLRLRQANLSAISGLRTLPDLTTLRGEHYADILERLFVQREDDLAASRFAFDAQIIDDARSEPASSTKIDDVAALGDIETAVAKAVPAEAAQLPKIYEPYVQVPPYPHSKLVERVASATKRRAGEAVVQEEDIPEGLRVTGRSTSAPSDQPSVVVRTRRSQITGGFSIDKSALLIPSERRLRSKAHLQFVASKPCAICETLPCHAHHITFAQPRGLSQKVSDEFTVPLCVAHHNELHAFGNEASWWRSQGIEPLGIANKFWRESANGATAT